MPTIFQSIIDYVTRSVLLTGEQLAIVLGPALLLAFLLDYLSRFVRARSSRILRLDAYTYLTAPGVMIHELGHAFFCLIFRHRIVKMRLFKPDHNGTLGSVEHSYNPRSIYQRIGNFFIGTGPIWFGCAVICLLAWLLLGDVASPVIHNAAPTSDASRIAAIPSEVGALAWQLVLSLLNPAVVSTWQFWVFAYLLFCIGSHITLSKSDINGAARGFVSLVAFVLLFNLLTLSLGNQFALRACQRLVQGSVVFYAAMSLVICLNLLLAAVLLLVSIAIGMIR